MKLQNAKHVSEVSNPMIEHERCTGGKFEIIKYTFSGNVEVIDSKNGKIEYSDIDNTEVSKPKETPDFIKPLLLAHTTGRSEEFNDLVSKIIDQDLEDFPICIKNAELDCDSEIIKDLEKYEALEKELLIAEPGYKPKELFHNNPDSNSKFPEDLLNSTVSSELNSITGNLSNSINETHKETSNYSNTYVVPTYMNVTSEQKSLITYIDKNRTEVVPIIMAFVVTFVFVSVLLQFLKASLIKQKDAFFARRAKNQEKKT